MVELRPVPRSPLVDRLQLTSRGGPKPSPRTQQFLRVYDLEHVRGGPKALLEEVQATIEQDPTADKFYAFSELAYLEAKKAERRSPRLAFDLYGASALAAYRYLFDQRFRTLRNPYDPEFRGACDLYNGSLESALRVICAGRGLLPGRTYTVHTANGVWHLTAKVRGGRWTAEDFEQFKFVSDYEIKGLKNKYQSYGLGVPLIAVRRRYQGEPPASKYYPEGMSFPVTAFLRPLPSTNQDCCDSTAEHYAVLELYDPLAVSDTAIGDLRVPLESDLTTPMAYFLNDPKLNQIATVGLLRPEKLLALRPDGKQQIMGLYMAQPYEPGKIPVLFVHGLWSSPMTWMEMLNDLRSVPAIRDNYQFWFYLYPTAEPFWVTAAQMRDDLEKLRRELDPLRQEPALDQMVLIGHSMGGLVARLQTIDSGNNFWHLVSDQPFSLVKAKPEVRRQLAEEFFFKPNPSIRQVITIGTPYRGSRFSNDITRWLSSRLIRLPDLFLQTQHGFYRDNKDLIRDDKLLRIENSIDSLAPDSPFFPVMLASYRAPWVKYHNIIGLVPRRGLTGYLASGSDGVVSYESAHMDDAVSEITVPSLHSTIHAHPRAILEVRRILLQNLVDLEHEQDADRVRTASLPLGVGPPDWMRPSAGGLRVPSAPAY